MTDVMCLCNVLVQCVFRLCTTFNVTNGFGWCLKESEEEIQEEMEEWWHFESPWWGCFLAFDHTECFRLT